MSCDFDELDRVFELASKNPGNEYPIEVEMFAFIVDNDLAEGIERKHENRKLVTRIKYRGVTLVWETRTTPWSEIKRRSVH